MMVQTDSMYRIIATILFLISPLLAEARQNQQAAADTTQSDKSLTVFLDCTRRCDENYIRTSIPFVNFSRDKQDADVHLLITQQQTGGGGTEFQLKFLGREQFDQRNDTLRYVSLESDTRDMQRRGLVKYIKTGLLPYVSRVSNLDDFEISYSRREGGSIQAQQQQQDRWNNWIFEIGGRTFFSGEESRSSIFLSGRLSAERITEDWKIDMFYFRNYNRRKFEDDDGTDVFTTESQFFRGLVVKSLSPHLSAGVITEARSSSRDNLDLSVGATPAIEYNIFPYSEFTEREISFQYGIMTLYNSYTDTTIFNKTEEVIYEQRLRGEMEFTQPWGEIEGSVVASSFLQDFSKNRLVFDMEFDIRITRGLSLNLSGRYSLINDQVFLSKEGISDEEQLLNLRQQATSYSFNGSIGLEYTFGSTFNSIVNPRF